MSQVSNFIYVRRISYATRIYLDKSTSKKSLFDKNTRIIDITSCIKDLFLTLFGQ